MTRLGYGILKKKVRKLTLWKRKDSEPKSVKVEIAAPTFKGAKVDVFTRDEDGKETDPVTAEHERPVRLTEVEVGHEVVAVLHASNLKGRTTAAAVFG